MTPPALKGLSASRQRALAAGLLVAAVGVVLLAVLAPIVLLHRHYDAAIDDMSDRLRRYQRVAAQAPALRAARGSPASASPASSDLRVERPADCSQY